VTDTELLKLVAKGVAHILRDVRHMQAKLGIYSDASGYVIADKLEAMADSQTADETDGMK
jgi:hypothetical protein